MRIFLLITILTSLANLADAAYRKRSPAVDKASATTGSRTRHTRIRGLQAPKFPDRLDGSTSTLAAKCDSKVSGVRGGAAGQVKGCSTSLTPANDQCAGASDISASTGSMVGATRFATSESVGTECGGVTLDGPGVWFRAMGTGGLMTATTCGDTDFDTKISVFEGFSCSGLQCVSTNDNTLHAGCALSSTADWQSEVGMIYYLLVRNLTLSMFCIVSIDDLTCGFLAKDSRS
jgi:hypothetical protein